MPDFSKLYKAPAGEAKRPPAIPGGDYPGIISGAHSEGESSQRKTPFIRFPLRLTDWSADAPAEWTQTDSAGNTESYTRGDVDIGARTWYLDFYADGKSHEFEGNALFRIDEFIRSCGIDPEGRSYEELFPLLIGQNVLVEITQQISQRSNEIFNQVGRVRGLANGS